MSNGAEELDLDHPLGEVPAGEPPLAGVDIGQDAYVYDHGYADEHDLVDPNSRGFRASEGPEEGEEQ